MIGFAAMGLVTLGTRAAEGTIAVEVKGERIEGQPLAWSSSRVSLLARDGRLVQFAPNEARNSRRVSDRFVSYSPSEMRARLQREFGQQFEVSGTGHFLVVHPRGTRDQWAMRFEELYRSFVHYFNVRGFRLDEPQFPLVAVVFRTQGEYLEYARRYETAVSPQVVGFYSGASNRIVMYDESGGRSAPSPSNLETLIHEAAHQSAFNTGIHNRYWPPPRWVCEGLGMLFEAPGVHDSRTYKNLQDRINRHRLERYRRYLVKRPPDALVNFLMSDRLFQTDPDAAYAEAWALTFFLCETRPKQYYQYLKATAGPDAATANESGEERLARFLGVFQTDLKLLEAHYQRFIAQL